MREQDAHEFFPKGCKATSLTQPTPNRGSGTLEAQKVVRRRWTRTVRSNESLQIRIIHLIPFHHTTFQKACRSRFVVHIHR